MTEPDKFDAPGDWEIRAQDRMTAALNEVLDVDAGLADALKRAEERNTCPLCGEPQSETVWCSCEEGPR